MSGKLIIRFLASLSLLLGDDWSFVIGLGLARRLMEEEDVANSPNLGFPHPRSIVHPTLKNAYFGLFPNQVPRQQLNFLKKTHSDLWSPVLLCSWH